MLESPKQIRGGTLKEIHPEFLKRKIIHVDMDAFFAAVEILDNPSLKGLPLVIGGSPQSRGVVCTASYEARKFGIRSAMACSQAYRLCPDAVFLMPRHRRYVEISKEIFLIFARYSKKIESVSLDEGYLDVTEECQGESASSLAKKIKEDIWNEIGITASAGVAPNKMLAKLASEKQKPDGLTVIRPESISAFMPTLPVKKINGIGPVTAEKLSKYGISLCSDIYKHRKMDLYEKLGPRLAEWLWDHGQGICRAPVENNHDRKSVGSEATFPKDLTDLDSLKKELQEIAQDVHERLSKKRLLAMSLTLKIKYADFSLETRSTRLSTPFTTSEEIFRYALLLLERGYKQPIRLLGLSLGRLQDRKSDVIQVQVPLF